MVENQEEILYNNTQANTFNLESIPTGDLLFPSTDEMLNFSPTDLQGHEESLHFSGSYANEFCNFASVGNAPIITSPNHWNALPIMDHVESPWEFEILLNGESSGKTSWLFSTKLNKVFVKINSYLNIYPKYKVQSHEQELFLRAMIVYTSPNEIGEPVKICPNHRSALEQEPNPDHILRCNTNETAYVGSENGKLFKEKLAILIPMRNVAHNEPIKLLFKCQNSCSSGMNRKSTSIIFTLEDKHGDMHGRHVLHFKVCSCPKRDKDKEEATTTNVKFMPKKRKNDPVLPSTSKKIAISPAIVKQESDVSMTEDFNVEVTEQDPGCELRIVLPNFDIKRRVLNTAIDIMAGEMLRNGVNYESFISTLKSQLNDTQTT